MDQAMIRKMQKLQKEFEAKNDEFMEKEFKIEKHGIEITVKGSKEIVSIKINDDILLDPEDPETLQDLLALVLNELFANIDQEQEALMPNVPGLGF